jgi:hypothetical protein
VRVTALRDISGPLAHGTLSATGASNRAVQQRGRVGNPCARRNTIVQVALFQERQDCDSPSADNLRRARRGYLFMDAGILRHCQVQLMQIVFASSLASALTGGLNCGQQQPDQYRQNAEDNHQFNNRDARPPDHHVLSPSAMTMVRHNPACHSDTRTTRKPV